MAIVEIRELTPTPSDLEALTDLLIETVANGGSVSFMHPLSREAAMRFWTGWLQSAERGERVALGAFDGQDLIGAVTLVLDCPPNQPHRAEIAKMMTRLTRRGEGTGSALLRRAEAIAAERGRWLVNLDTAAEEGASGFYERNGYRFAGEIPDYALKPHGGLTATRLYWKRLVSERV